MQYTYLWINILTFFFPFVLSFDKKVAFYKRWYALFPAIALMSFVFILWDHWFTLEGVWGFNRLYVSGLFLLSLPIEEWLFFITVPYACVFTYECLVAYFPKGFTSKWFHLYIPLLLAVATLGMLVWNYHKIYTAVTMVLLLFLFGLRPTRNLVFLRYFIPTFLLILLPMFVVNGLLTSKPVVYYHPEGFSGFRLGTIPIEDFFYNLAMLLLTFLFYRLFQRKSKKELELGDAAGSDELH
jgi:lycopene cyclase domain-containing protein